jgi:hypothetical protein
LWCTLPTAASAQSPGAAIPEALRAVIGRWCSGSLALTPAPNLYFPAVRFTRGRCHNEHGDALTAVAAIDRDSVLYLLASPASFHFLVARHPVRLAIDSARVLDYARMALELSGHIDATARVVAQWDDIPVAARDSARRFSVRPVQITRAGRDWEARLFTIRHVSQGVIVEGFDVIVTRTGRADVLPGWNWRRLQGP